MKEIMTAEEFRSDYLKLMVEAGKITEEDIIKAYATYIIESLTDEERKLGIATNERSIGFRIAIREALNRIK